ncbi:hypothetical protein B0H34DRAFT_241977 [Crassisporium funariophilum]|nr:hypothetical protein B0H34DRAFT_241977 [Crassisporium funariophilum]
MFPYAHDDFVQLESKSSLADIPVLFADIQVTPLRQVDVWRASKTWFDAFLDDPLIQYLSENKQSSVIQRPAYMAVLARWIYTKITLTVNKGAALIIATPVKQEPAVGMQRVMDSLTKWVMRKVERMGRKESRKRLKEVREKLDKVVAETLGDRKEQMLYIDLVATEPKSQGHGYGGALVDAVTTLADLMGQATWLQSSNIDNTEFYNSHGFVTVGKAYIGDDNPEWHGGPVIVSIMVRECRSQPLIDEKA